MSVMTNKPDAEGLGASGNGHVIYVSIGAQTAMLFETMHGAWRALFRAPGRMLEPGVVEGTEAPR